VQVLAAIRSTRPLPIRQPFGDAAAYGKALRSFYPPCNPSDTGEELVANMLAYAFWEIQWGAYQRVATLQAFSDLAAMPDVSAKNLTSLSGTIDFDDEHLYTWCSQHGLNPSALLSVRETLDTILEVLFLERYPLANRLIDCNNLCARWMAPALYSSSMGSPRAVVQQIYDDASLLKIAAFVRAALAKLRQESPAEESAQITGFPSATTMPTAPNICRFYLRGACRFGKDCRYFHGSSGTRENCVFHMLGLGCVMGSNCLFEHSRASSVPSGVQTVHDRQPSAHKHGSALGFFRREHGRVVLLGEGDLRFTAELIRLGLTPFGSSTRQDRSQVQALLSATTLALIHDPKAQHMLMFYGVDATCLHIDRVCGRRLSEDLGRGLDRFVVWNFPYIDGAETNDEAHQELMFSFFRSLTCLVLRSAQLRNTETGMLRVGLTLHGDQLSRWHLLRAANASFWKLSSWDFMNLEEFPDYQPARANGEPFPISRPKLYLFEATEIPDWVGAAVGASDVHRGRQHFQATGTTRSDLEET
jgi:hypothetical protein